VSRSHEIEILTAPTQRLKLRLAGWLAGAGAAAISWGTDWGEDGYYRVVRGKNRCGVATDAIHSVV
jgi:hypothetical protein